MANPGRKARRVWWPWFFAGGVWLCFIWIGLWSSDYPEVLRRSPLREHAAVFAIATLVAVVACIPLGRALYTEAERRNRSFLIPLAVLFGIPIALVLILGARTLNGYLDSSAQGRFTTKVVAKEKAAFGRSWSHRLRIEDWLDRRNTVSINVPAKLYLEISEGVPLLITTRKGYFNTEWMVELAQP